MSLQSNDYNDNNRNQYSFKDQESEQIFYLKLDSNNEPIKLGDGTFGVVFEALNRVKDALAVKILYEYSAPGTSNENSESMVDKDNTESTPDSIKKRFENEIKSTQHILELSKDPKLTRVIKILGWTREFKSSELYQELQNKFTSLKLSNYALVTEKYDHTLKNLLEGGIKKYKSSQKEMEEPVNSREELEKNKNGQGEIIYELTGYDILKEMNFEERIATILPYLLDIAQGLETIHKANLCHLDLKPANIFVKEDASTVQSVIGDLGFLYVGEKPKFEALPVANLQLPLGTRHYRSPEQKDYFDICDVEVQVCNSTSTENQNENYDVRLITYDPKLRDTIIEKDDYIVFSKNKKAYGIKSIEVDTKSENSPICIYLNIDPKKNDLSNDKKTQVILYKRQTERTDLFGFGAIVYDLLTCGGSPERFYENIRVIYDKEDKNVTDIMEDYLKVSNFQSSEPSLVQVFEPLKRNKTSSSYAPSDIVKIILQCMLYKAGTTFYSLSQAKNSEDEQQTPVGMLLESLFNLTEDFNGNYKVKNRRNPLLNKTWNSAISSHNPVFLVAIKDLQKMKINNLWQRIAQGFWYLQEISRLVQDLLESPNFSFSELLPTNFAISDRNGLPDSLNLKFKLYDTEDSYQKDLRNDSLYTKITRDIGNPFVPNYLEFIRRKILLVKDGKKITYQFLDSSLYGDIVEKNDWIILKSKNSNNLLFKVEEEKVDQTSNTKDQKLDQTSNTKDQEVDQTSNTIEKLVCVNKDSTDIEIEEDIEIENYTFSDEGDVYYKYIDREVYYLNMIGIYIYQIFFVGINNHTQSKPYITDELNILKRNNSNSKIEIKIEKFSDHKKPSISFFPKPKHELNHEVFILRKTLDIIVSIYLKLTFFESQDSYFGRKDSRNSSISLLLQDIKKLRDSISEATNIDITRKYPNGKFPELEPDQLEGILKPFNEMISDQIKFQAI